MSGSPGGLGGLNNPYLGEAGYGIPGAAGGCAPGDPNCQNGRPRSQQNFGGWAPPGMGYGAGGGYGASPQAALGAPPASLDPFGSSTALGPAGQPIVPYNRPTILNQAPSWNSPTTTAGGSLGQYQAPRPTILNQASPTTTAGPYY